MHDTNAVARPAEDPDTVLPYDPDDWERRLAAARVRRAEALKRSAHGQDAPPPRRPARMFAAPAKTTHNSSAPSRTPPATGAEDWKRRLAEARGLAATGIEPAVGPVHADQGAASLRNAGTGPRRTPTPSAVVPVQTEPQPADEARATEPGAAGASAPTSAQGRGWLTSGVVALGGLAAGVALTLALTGATPTGGPEKRGDAARNASGLPDGLVAVGASPAGLGGPPSVPVVASHLSRTGAFGPPPRTAVPKIAAAPTVAATPSLARQIQPLPTPPPARPEPTSGTIATTQADPFVVLHVPGAPAPNADAPLAESRAQGWPVVSVDFIVSRSHLRVYHDGDRDAASVLGARLGLPVRDFVGVVPAPEGLIEVWIAGTPEPRG